MLVSVITIFYNRADLVHDSIQSLLNQTYRNIEIIAVDDGSTDDTLDRLRSFDDPRLRVITHPNKGLIHSIIEAVELAQGELIAIHGSGDISYPERIEEQVNLLKSKPEVGVVGCIVENTNLITGESSQFYVKDLERIDVTKHLLSKGNVFTHGEVMYRKSIYEKVGGYRTTFVYSQDLDLWLRMSLVTKFSNVEKKLYRRFKVPGGVSTVQEKQLMQIHLAELARQCCEMRLETGEDLVDRFGILSPFLRRRTRRFSSVLLQHAITELREKRLDHASAFIRLSLRERWMVKNWLFSQIIRIMRKSETIGEQLVRLYDWIVKMRGKLRRTFSLSE